MLFFHAAYHAAAAARRRPPWPRPSRTSVAAASTRDRRQSPWCTSRRSVYQGGSVWAAAKMPGCPGVPPLWRGRAGDEACTPALHKKYRASRNRVDVLRAARVFEGPFPPCGGRSVGGNCSAVARAYPHPDLPPQGGKGPWNGFWEQTRRLETPSAREFLCKALHPVPRRRRRSAALQVTGVRRGSAGAC